MSDSSEHVNDAPRPVEEGHYAHKQLSSPASVIAFSHRSRFETAMKLAGRYPNGRLLDYGSGDGTFLSMVSQHFGSCVGADLALDQVEDCRRRFAGVSNVNFCDIQSLATDHDGAYDVVTCMEVLEHCTARAFDTVVRDLARLVAPDGRVIISVPVEIGLSFMLKYLVRTIAGWRGVGDYGNYERYPLGDAMRMVFATSRTRLNRPVYNQGGGDFHSHYGFNWRHVTRHVGNVLRIERTLFSPFNSPLGMVDSQAWLVCRPIQPR